MANRRLLLSAHVRVSSGAQRGNFRLLFISRKASQSPRSRSRGAGGRRIFCACARMPLAHRRADIYPAPIRDGPLHRIDDPYVRKPFGTSRCRNMVIRNALREVVEFGRKPISFGKYALSISRVGSHARFYRLYILLGRIQGHASASVNDGEGRSIGGAEIAIKTCNPPILKAHHHRGFFFDLMKAPPSKRTDECAAPGRHPSCQYVNVLFLRTAMRMLAALVPGLAGLRRIIDKISALMGFLGIPLRVPGIRIAGLHSFLALVAGALRIVGNVARLTALRSCRGVRSTAMFAVHCRRLLSKWVTRANSMKIGHTPPPDAVASACGTYLSEGKGTAKHHDQE
jgi:hypothetical protein